MKNSILFEDDDYVLVRRYFSNFLTLSFIGSFYIILKDRKLTFKATWVEKSYLFNLIYQLKKLNILYGSDEFSDAMRDFCSAVSSKGGVRYDCYFGESENEKASDYCQ